MPLNWRALKPLEGSTNCHSDIRCADQAELSPDSSQQIHAIRSGDEIGGIKIEGISIAGQVS